LPLKMPVYFHQGEKFAIFTFHGARIQVSGVCQSYYKSDKTPMQYYVNVHSAFNQMRNEALKLKKVGPTILITGSNNSGKSTLCRILANYSLRLGWRPVLCDIDLNSNEISPPGCIAAAAVDDPLPNDDLTQSALCFFHGSISPDKTLEFFDKQIQELSKAVRTLQENDLSNFNRDNMIDATAGGNLQSYQLDEAEI